MLSNHKNYGSSTNISFYKPQNNMKKFNKASTNKSSVSIRSNNASQNVGKPQTQIDCKRRQLIRSIDSFPENQTRNSSRSSKYQRKIAQHRASSSQRRKIGFGSSTHR
mmetsp:Transcript_15459/g.13497  ORF Transcript_15459/g.13497 Transcript_15459/m.13497 type:complete len:108 (-) Transcript_15459:30-353(-)